MVSYTTTLGKTCAWQAVSAEQPGLGVLAIRLCSSGSKLAPPSTMPFTSPALILRLSMCLQLACCAVRVPGS